MKWILHAMLEVVAIVVAFLTNWFVVLFADEYGWLPDWLYWWQTWDNTLDVEWMISEGVVPEFARYDYNKHYRYHYEVKNDDGTYVAGHVDLLDPNFTLKERLQRYYCRARWLYRNSNYGFSHFVNGVDVEASELVVVKDIQEKNNELFVGYVPRGLWASPWCLYVYRQYCKWFCVRVYLGWKMKGKSSGRHQIAIFFSPFREVQ